MGNNKPEELRPLQLTDLASIEVASYFVKRCLTLTVGQTLNHLIANGYHSSLIEQPVLDLIGRYTCVLGLNFKVMATCDLKGRLYISVTRSQEVTVDQSLISACLALKVGQEHREKREDDGVYLAEELRKRLKELVPGQFAISYNSLTFSVVTRRTKPATL